MTEKEYQDKIALLEQKLEETIEHYEILLKETKPQKKEMSDLYRVPIYYAGDAFGTASADLTIESINTAARTIAVRRADD